MVCHSFSGIPDRPPKYCLHSVRHGAGATPPDPDNSPHRAGFRYLNPTHCRFYDPEHHPTQPA
ncbi:hypothetical protein BGX38DRAFT_1175685 [Terfezia claveryi]|nr:hypothetical protein BGX38DRAFT_1175685 [Terfezia claveryi]